MSKWPYREYFLPDEADEFAAIEAQKNALTEQCKLLVDKRNRLVNRAIQRARYDARPANIARGTKRVHVKASQHMRRIREQIEQAT